MEQQWLPMMRPRRCSDVYFAFSPDEAERGGALAIARTVCGDLYGAECYHVTLAHVGRWFDAVHEEMIDRASWAAQALAERAFDLPFDRLEAFGAGGEVGPLVLCSRSRIPALDAFRMRLGEAMARERVGRRHGSRVNPHMTLSYKCRRLPGRPLAPAFIVRARRLVLIESHYGEGRHTVREEWTLAG
jgi:2'-5' RNA ligase